MGRGALESSLDVGIGLRILGQAMLEDDPPETAFAKFRESLSILKDHSSYEAAHTELQWGCALLAGGEVEPGLHLVRQSRAKFEQLGARRDLDTADTILRQRGCL